MKQLLGSSSAPSHLVLLNQVPTTPLPVFAIRQDPQIRVLSSAAAPENGLHPALCIRIQVPHQGECLAAELRGLDASGENLKLMPLARPSMSCFNECAIDSHHHSLSRFGENTGAIDFAADLLFDAFTNSERSVACCEKI